MSNRQLGNVGNLGDILKHGCLVQLARRLAERGEPIVYIDTHTFLMEAPCPDVAAWRRSVRKELDLHSALQGYRDLEEAALSEAGEYLCSTGLVLAALPESPRLILSEADPGTRAQLRAQLVAHGREAVLLENASELAGITAPNDSRFFLALVDPFTLRLGEWRAIAKGLERLTDEGIEGIAEVFTFDRSKGATDWPTAPRGMHGPIAEVQRGPFRLALYATPAATMDAAEVGAPLGWCVQARLLDRAVSSRRIETMCTGCDRDTDVKHLLDCLAKHKQRATYRALVDYRGGGNPMSIMGPHDRDARHAWIVAKKTGLPGGDNYPVPPSFPTGRGGIITTGRDLRKFVDAHCPQRR